MTNNKRIGGNTRRKKGGSYAGFMSKMQGHLDRGIAAASAEVKKRGASLMPKLDTLRGHVSDVKTKLSAAKEEAHAQVGHALVRAHAYAHASGFGPSVMSHFNKAKTLARGFGSMRKGSFFRKGGYGSSKKKPSGGTKKKCGQRGGYGSSKKKPSGGTKKKRGGNKRCGHTKKRGHKRGGTRTRRGGNCKKCGM